MADYHQPYVTIRTRHANDGSSMSSADSAYGSGNGGLNTPSATHDTSRVNYHVKHLDSFAKTLEESAGRAFPNTGKSSQRYNKVQALLLHWKSDDLFVLPELEDLQKCLRDDYSFDTDIFSIPSDNAHLELMMRVGSLVKEHEAHDTLFIVYYGGHARIDESRQSTWCATRQPRSPSLQWSAIQTLLERSVSDVLVLLDCCAGAASATFPSGKSITETISASSWDAIAPDPGRYSFTNALIEVLQEWRIRTFSAAMLHAEVLARLKHPRPITINGKHFEARSTPVHFMMTSNHKAPSIELTKLVPADARPPSPPQEPWEGEEDVAEGAGRGPGTEPVSGPNEDEPHVMISLALEDNQELDLNAWEQWLAAFPALAKHVKVQGVFKSHSTLLLLSMPVMIWDLLPEDHACSFVAFIRSNNLIKTSQSSREEAEEEVADDAEYDSQSIISGTTYTPADERGRLDSIYRRGSTATTISQRTSRSLTPASMTADLRDQLQNYTLRQTRRQHGYAVMDLPPDRPLDLLNRQMTTPAAAVGVPYVASRRDVEQPSPRSRLNQTGAIYDGGSSSQISRPRLSSQVVDRLEEYFQEEHHHPTFPVMEFFSSTLGVRLSDIDAWFHNRRQQQLMNDNLQNLRPSDHGPEAKEGAKMILPGHLNTLLEIFPPSQVLLVDLRSPTDFEKSHVHGAVNLRIPLSFVRDAASDLDLVEMAFTDEQSRRCFSRWKSAKCIVFYDRVVEFPWECPVADAMYEQFKRESWEGQCYILKGHYREFSASFDKYISGNKMTQGAKDYVDGLRERATPSQDESRQNQERYSEWVHLLENEDRVPSTELIPSKKAERMRAVEQHQSELQTEFEGRFPALVTKARSLRPAAAAAAVAPAKRSSVAAEAAAWLESRKRTTTSSSNSTAAAAQRASAKGKDKYGDDGDDFGAKAQYVEPLAKGLQKMQKEGRGRGRGGGGGGVGNDADVVHDSPPSPRTPAPPYSYQATTYDKLSGEAAAGADDFDDIDPKDEQLRNDPAFQKAGDLGDAHRRAVKDGRFWKLLQRNK